MLPTNANHVLLHRSTDGRSHQLTLATPTATVQIELRVTCLDLSASELERMLHAPLAIVAERLRGGGCERI